MGVRLLSTIFGKNPAPSPTGDVAPVPPAKSPIAKARLASLSKENAEMERKPEPSPRLGETEVKTAKLESDPKTVECEESSVTKRSAGAASKVAIGVGGNVLAEIKARQERRISGVMKQNSEESDFSERSERIDSKANLSPIPLGPMRLRPALPTPEEAETPKMDIKSAINPLVRFRPSGGEEIESERSKPSNPLTAIRLRPRGVAEDSEGTMKSEEKSNLLNIRQRAVEESDVSEKSDVKPNPLSGVRLRSTGINVVDPLKSPNNGSNIDNDTKSESRNSLSKLKPPPLAPKPRPWSIVGSDKKLGNFFALAHFLILIIYL